MAKADKILERLSRQPPEMDLADLVQLFDALGWEFPDNGKSHQIVRTREGFPITIALVQGRRVKRGYLKRIQERIEAEEGR